MESIGWVIGGAVFVVIFGAKFVFIAARAWAGEAVGAMRVRKRYINGTHTRLKLVVRRGVRGKSRDVYIVIGPLWMNSALMLSQVNAVRGAGVLERAAAEADSRP